MGRLSVVAIKLGNAKIRAMATTPNVRRGQRLSGRKGADVGADLLKRYVAGISIREICRKRDTASAPSGVCCWTSAYSSVAAEEPREGGADDGWRSVGRTCRDLPRQRTRAGQSFSEHRVRTRTTLHHHQSAIRTVGHRSRIGWQFPVRVTMNSRHETENFRAKARRSCAGHRG